MGGWGEWWQQSICVSWSCQVSGLSHRDRFCLHTLSGGGKPFRGLQHSCHVLLCPEVNSFSKIKKSGSWIINVTILIPISCFKFDILSSYFFMWTRHACHVLAKVLWWCFRGRKKKIQNKTSNFFWCWERRVSLPLVSIIVKFCDSPYTSGMVIKKKQLVWTSIMLSPV